MGKVIQKNLVYMLVVLLSTGCASLKPPDIGGLYSRAASYSDQERNPVIVIPGILGSKLAQEGTGKPVWGAFERKAANPKKPEGARLIALPMEKGKSLHQLKDDVVSAGALDRVAISLFWVPIRLNAYFHILRALGVGGYRDQNLSDAGAVDYGDAHFTCFQFDYDWRRDTVENARALGEFIKKKKKYVEAEFEKRYGVKKDVKFDIVAHSMGGLAARYFLRFGGEDLPPDGSAPRVTWKGAKHVDKVVLIGTPSAGSTHALIQLTRGIAFGPFLPKYSPAILGTMPAIYQLLPRPRHEVVLDLANNREALDVYDIEVWKEKEWGLANPKQDKELQKLLPGISTSQARREIALEHLEKVLQRAKQFAAAMDQPAKLPKDISLNLFVGDAVPTAAVLGVTKKGELEILETSPGDGTVIRSSALMDERLAGEWMPKLVSPIPWSHVVFLFADHLGLTKDPVFIDNILYFLLENPT